MATVRSAQSFRSLGYDAAMLRGLQREGGLRRIRRGVYADGPLPASDVAQRRELVQATAAVSHPSSVISHQSAALLHRLPTFRDWDRRVHLTRPRGLGSGRIKPAVHIHVADLGPDETVMIDGLRATSLVRTVLDLARTLPFPQGVAVGDAALRLGVDPEVLAQCLVDAPRMAGTGAARRAIGSARPSQGDGWGIVRTRRPLRGRDGDSGTAV